MGDVRSFRGRIAGVGSVAGTRVVVGWWQESPFGPFADAMVETASGHRVLLAPSDAVRELVAGTYLFDEARVEPVAVSPLAGPGRGPFPAHPTGHGGHLGPPAAGWSVVSPSLRLDLTVGRRLPLGRLLRLVPAGVAGSPWWATLVDPVAGLVMPGVRTRGVARAGRREYYGATDLHAVTAMTGAFDGIPLGDLRPVDPPCRFGFSSTPRRPSVTDVVTTIRDA